MNNKDEHKHIYIEKINNIIKDWYVHTMEILSQCQQKLEWNTMDQSVKILIHAHLLNKHDPFPVRSIEKRNILKKEMIPTLLIYKSYIENLHHLDYIIFIIREWSNDKCSFNQVLTLLVWKHYESLETIDKNRKNLDTIKKKISGSPFIFDQLVLGVTEAFFSPETFQTYDPAVKAQLTIVTDTYQQNNQLLIEAFNYYRLADKTACDVADPNPSSDGEDYKYKSKLKRISINASCVELFDSMVSLHPNFRGDRTYLGNIDEVLSSASKSDLINIEKLQKKGDEKGNVINETDRKYKIILKNNVVVFNDLEKTKEKNRTKNLKKKQRRKRRNQESAILAQTSNNRALNDNISGSAYSLLDRPPEPHIANIAPASADDVCTPNSAQPMHSPSSSTETNDANLPNHMSNTVFEEPVETKGVCARIVHSLCIPLPLLLK
ncbi:MAG: hypothetical protein IPP74_01010 [Alphaproteobacteria bacterium]|nr:hypothetical protein [Alphaproteobacteria bacterium]